MQQKCKKCGGTTAPIVRGFHVGASLKKESQFCENERIFVASALAVGKIIKETTGKTVARKAKAFTKKRERRQKRGAKKLNRKLNAFNKAMEAANKRNEEIRSKKR